MEVTGKHIGWGSLVVLAAGASTLIAFWSDIGGPVPLTKHSPVVEALHEVDREYRDRFQIQELDVAVANAEIRRIETARLEGSIESDGYILGQFDRPDLTEGERFEKSRLIRRIEKHKRELDRLDKK